MPDAAIPTRNSSVHDWAKAIAKPTLSPAAGSAAAIAGASAAAIVEMVAAMTAEREAYALVHEEARAARARAEGLRQELLTLASADAGSLQRFAEALALPKSNEVERELRDRSRRSALREAAEIQRDVLAACQEVATLGAAMAERGLETARADALTAVFLAAGAAKGAAHAVRVNLADEPAGSEFSGLPGAAAKKLADVEETERQAARLASQPPT